MKKNKRNGDLIQILLNIVILGVFSIVENWLLFFYGQSWILVVIFDVLMILVSCLLAINIFNCVKSIRGTVSSQTEGQSADSAGNDKQIYALLYKQMKEIQKNQLLGTKAVLDKMSSISAEEKEQIREILQETAVNPAAAEKETAVPEDVTVPAAELAAAEKEIEVPEDITIPEEIPIPDIAIQQEEADGEPEEADFTLENIVQEENESGIEDLLDGDLGDPNKELTPDEIAALFANIN